MSNQVYANMMEVSCKAASGKSIAAFPDTCFTPPQTPATPPGVPIPYPNTGMASDTSDGSTSVTISGQEVMLKNKSYFKKSTGDEAGCAPKKGVVTGVIQGKVYFTAWSMDVMVEGENVVRHLDLMTHNHGSVPGNTPTWPYLDAMSPAAMQACSSESDAVKSKCPNCDQSGKTHEDCPPYHEDADRNAGYGNDPCVKAKRCMLSPFSASKNKLKGEGGCCPGQTAHHIVPKHHFVGLQGYDQAAAPCVCAEGHSWHDNEKSWFPPKEKTHPQMHQLQDTHERDLIALASSSGASTAMTYKEARDGGLAAHATVFSGAGCSSDCMKAQIDAYHRQCGVQDDSPVVAKAYGNTTAPATAKQAFKSKYTSLP